MMDFITAPLVVGFICLGIYALFELLDVYKRQFQIKGESNTEEKVFFVAGIKDGEKCALMVMLSEPLVAEGLNAGKLVKEAAKLIQGGGGGQPHFATAGGKNVAGLGEAIEHILDAAGLK